MRRNLQLDFLRFCGVALVMIHHLGSITNYPNSGRLVNFLNNIHHHFQWGGWVGVDLFFVLSGYLVSGLIIKEYQIHGSFNAKTFLIRRGLKIYPTYYIFIVYQFLFSYYFLHKPQTLSGLFHEAIFVANYFDYNNIHLWSISVEEHFYFGLALVFLILIKFQKVNLKSILIIYFVCLTAGILFRLHNFYSYSIWDFDRDYTRSHIRIDALFLGVVLAFVSNYRKEIFNKILINRFRSFYFVLALLFLSTNFVFNRDTYRLISVVSLALNPVCFGYILILVINYKNPLFLKVISPLSFIGMFSYSIYLFHLNFLMITDQLFKLGTGPYIVFYFTSSVIGGIIISKCIEYPIIKYRERHFPSKSRNHEREA